MILDAQMLLSDAQALTATAVSTNTYDTQNAGDDVSVGEPLVMAVGVDVAADFTTGNETYQFGIIESAASNLSSATELVARVIAASLLTLGSLHIVPMPQGSKTLRYLGANYTLGGTTPTITVTTWFTLASMIQRDKKYTRGYTVTV